MTTVNKRKGLIARKKKKAGPHGPAIRKSESKRFGVNKRKPRKIERKSWWHRMTPAAQKAYKKAHPNSKLKIGSK